MMKPINEKVLGKLKTNLATFKNIPTETRWLMEAIGRDNFVYLSSNGEWIKNTINNPSHSFADQVVYRLKDDYGQVHSLFSCDVTNKPNCMMYEFVLDEITYELDEAIACVGFIGTEYVGSNLIHRPYRYLMPLSALELVENVHSNIPVRVWFTKAKSEIFQEEEK